MILVVCLGTTDTHTMDQQEKLAGPRHMMRHLKVAVMNGKTHGCGSYLLS